MASNLPIVFIHGATSDATVWDAQVLHFVPRGGAWAVDLTEFDDIGRMADHVLSTAPKEFVVCGTSMGGYVALDVLQKAQGRVKKAILCNTTARPDTAERTAQRMADVALGEEVFVRARKLREHYKEFLSEKSAQDDALIERLRAVSMRVGYDCYKRHQIACSQRPDKIPYLPQIDLPVLIISGAEDKVIPPPLQQEMHEKIKGSTLRTIADTGHCTHMEDPDATIAAFEQFLEAA